MRLLITGINWPPETFLRRLIHGLVDAGVEVTIGSAKRPKGMGEEVKWLRTPSWDAGTVRRLAHLASMTGRVILRGLKDARVFAPAVCGSSGVGQRLQFWNRLLPYAGRRWDVIYFPWNSAAIACLPVLDLDCPVVVSCRGAQVSVAPHNPQRSQMRNGLPQVFKKAAVVHCVSQAILKEASQLGLDPVKAKVIRPAVDPQWFKPPSSRGDNDQTLSVISVGSVIWRKGYEWALQAIRKSLDRGINVHYEIIGDGPDRQRILYTINDLDLGSDVTLLGRLDPGQVLARMQQADAFLLSSLSEGISNAVLEAMACGLPVVTTDCGGMREAVTDGVEGFVVPVRDAQAIETAIQRLAADPDLRRRMGEAGRRRVVEEFDLSQQIDQWVTLFQSVAESYQKPRTAAGAHLRHGTATKIRWPGVASRIGRPEAMAPGTPCSDATPEVLPGTRECL